MKYARNVWINNAEDVMKMSVFSVWMVITYMKVGV